MHGGGGHGHGGGGRGHSAFLSGWGGGWYGPGYFDGPEDDVTEIIDTGAGYPGGAPAGTAAPVVLVHHHPGRTFGLRG